MKKQLKTMRTKALQNGVTLFITLIFLAVLTMISLTAMQGSTLGEKIANNEIDRNLAFQAAEAGLRDAEKDLLFIRADAVTCTQVLCRPDSRVNGSLNIISSNFTATCPRGLCSNDRWQIASSWSSAVSYGTYTGATALPNVVQQPRYLIELFSFTSDGGKRNFLYRVTSRGFGAVTSSQVTLQAMYILEV